MELEELLQSIPDMDENAENAARSRQQELTKPRGSLGKLEHLSIQIAGITANPSPRLDQKVVFVMAGDHGVASEGVSAYPPEVTAQMMLNFLHGGAAINVLARHVGAKVVIVDMGVAVDLPHHPDLVVKKIGRATHNITLEAAMTRAQAIQAILAGAELARSEIEHGAKAIATGEMGIGNTTPSAAIMAALKAAPLEICVGRGTGLDDEGLKRKRNVVEQALRVNQPNPRDGLDVLSKLGGFEIAGLVGVILGGASMRVPVVLDGFITGAAAMVAVTLQPRVRHFLIASHCSKEQGHPKMLEWLSLNPLLDLDLRLGEGSGAVLGLFILDAACKILSEMATFSEAGVSDKDDLSNG
ncbi:MAG: nicotinate-nucleotide--dimethylbenzimidazole phosphoribosyltransferase [Anaerolineales bacterium]